MPQAAMPEGENKPVVLPIAENISPDARELIVMSRRALVDEKAGDAMMNIVANAKQIAYGAALVAFKLIARGEDNIPDLDPKEVYGDQGAGEYILDAIFGLAQQDGIPGSDDPEQFKAARELLEEFASGVYGLTNEQGDPNAQPPGQEAAPEEAPEEMQPQGARAPILSRG